MRLYTIKYKHINITNNIELIENNLLDTNSGNNKAGSIKSNNRHQDTVPNRRDLVKNIYRIGKIPLRHQFRGIPIKLKNIIQACQRRDLTHGRF